MSYDDLAYHGFDRKANGNGAGGNGGAGGGGDNKANGAAAGAVASVFCPDCKHNVSVPLSRVVTSSFSGLRSVRCPDCGRLTPLDDQKDAKANGGGDDEDDARAGPAGSGRGGGGANVEMLHALLGSLAMSGPEVIDFDALGAGPDGGAGGGGGGGAGGSAFAANRNMLEMMRAQRGVNIDDLMQQLLTATANSNQTPASEAFMKALTPAPIALRDFVQVLLTVDGLKRELIVTVSDDFGQRIADSHDLNAKADNGVQLQQSAPLVACDPPEGGPGPVHNADALRGKFVLMKRGKIPFAEKARVAAKAGAAGLVVLQSDDGVWPYQMTDQTKASADIKLPCVMVSAKDGAVLTAVLNGTYADVKTDHKQITKSAVASATTSSAAVAAAPASSSASSSSTPAAAASAPAPAASSSATPATATTATTTAATTSAAATTTDFSSLSLTAATPNVPLTAAPTAPSSSSAAAATGSAAGAGASGAIAGAVVRVITRERKLACPVCREDFVPATAAAPSVALKLPCNHFYCADCLKPWLAKRNTCMLCRFELPTDTPKPTPKSNAPPPTNPAVLQLRENMFS